jgi:5'-nucleotidase (lipoprotein e(P4) family)
MQGKILLEIEEIARYFCSTKHCTQSCRQSKEETLPYNRNLKLAALLLMVAFGCAHSISQQTRPRQIPNDIRWVTESIEYAAVCSQVYRNAWDIVKAGAKNESGNWVVVFDVDETVLDNSGYALERVAVDSGFTEASWANWVLRKEATPTPGAKAFIDSVRSLPRGHIAFITDRLYAHEQATVENLKTHGLFRDGDVMLTKTGPEDHKEDRRQCLQTGAGRCEKPGPLVILALFGDNVRDFIPMRGKQTADAYRKNELPQDVRWGTTFFMLPNPNYGSWQREYK